MVGLVAIALMDLITMRLPDPVRRPGWVRVLSSAKQATALIRDYLTSRIGCQDENESRQCKAFLRTFSTLSAMGNTRQVELRIGARLTKGSAVIYVAVDGAKATACESLVVPMSPRIVHILREVSDSRLFEIKPELKPVDPMADDVKKRPAIHTKVETRIIPGNYP